MVIKLLGYIDDVYKPKWLVYAEWRVLWRRRQAKYDNIAESYPMIKEYFKLLTEDWGY